MSRSTTVSTLNLRSHRLWFRGTVYDGYKLSQKGPGESKKSKTKTFTIQNNLSHERRSRPDVKDNSVQLCGSLLILHSLIEWTS